MAGFAGAESDNCAAVGSDGGHVFVAPGRLEGLAADAFVVPTDRRFAVEQKWWAVCGDPERAPEAPPGWFDGERVAAGTGKRPIWFLDVATDSVPVAQEPLRWLLEGVEQALRAAGGATVSGEPDGPGTGRERRLVAMPVLGVAGGGYGPERGRVVDGLLDRARSVAAETGADVALVTLSEADRAAAQATRLKRVEDYFTLSTDRQDEARRLGDLAAEGSLALLIGAGVSVPAGIPSWKGLLEAVIDRCGIALDLTQFFELDVLDQAEYLQSQLDGGLQQELRDLCAVEHYALGHALLAGLHCREVVTTNFDDLFERAVRAADDPPQSLCVLPWERPQRNEPWLLKMHGDVAHDGSIVLTRGDFVRYDVQRRPVASMVQTLLVSRHLLVVGASMTDDNVLRLAYEVTEFLDQHEVSQELGTVLTLQRKPIPAQLWEGKFRYVAASDLEIAGQDRADAADVRSEAAPARDLEILIDAISMFASDTGPYLLDSRYEHLLDAEERDLADAARALAEQLEERREDGQDRWSRLRGVLTDLGYRDRRGGRSRLR